MESATQTTPRHPPNTPALPSHLGQIDALQLLRAIAVILVIWFHSLLALNFTGSHALPSLGAFGIDIFFVISGFILSLVVLRERSHPGLQPMLEFMRRRVLRIYPIYWIVSIFNLARLAASHHLFEHNWVPAFFLLPSLHYPNQSFIIDFSWTMSFEIFFYFLLGILLFKTIKCAVPHLFPPLHIVYSWILSTGCVRSPPVHRVASCLTDLGLYALVVVSASLSP